MVNTSNPDLPILLQKYTFLTNTKQGAVAAKMIVFAKACFGYFFILVGEFLPWFV
jgi:hypothetical protein